MNTLSAIVGIWLFVSLGVAGISYLAPLVAGLVDEIRRAIRYRKARRIRDLARLHPLADVLEFRRGPRAAVKAARTPDTARRLERDTLARDRSERDLNAELDALEGLS